MKSHPTASIEEQIAELRARIALLEDTLDHAGILPAASDAQPLAAPVQPAAPQAVQMAPAAAPAQPIAPPPAPAPPSFGFSSSASIADRGSLESRIGSQWFNRIGILAVLIAAAWFLKLAMDNHWIGPLGRVLIGLLAGGGLMAWSERFRARGYTAFSYSLKAIGSGILYLSLWAAFSVFHLVPSGAAFAAMIAVTAFNGYMAWMQNAELLALYAIVGGLCTPALLSTGDNREAALFTYLLLLDLAVLALVALRPWSRLLFGAFAGTVLYFAGWWFAFYSDAQALRTAFFLTGFFLLFAFAPQFVQLNVPRGFASSAWDSLVTGLLPIVNAALGFIAFYSLLAPSQTDWASPWLATAFAAFYLFLHRLPARGRLRQSPDLLSSLHLSASVVFLTIAIPLKTHGRWLTVGWLVEGAALLWVANRVRSVLLQSFAVLSMALGLFTLLTINPPAGLTPIFNQRFATYCAAIAVFIFAARTASQNPADARFDEFISWPALAAATAVAVNALILLAIGLEIDSYWWRLRWHGDPALYNHYRMYAQFSYSAWFMLFGAVLLSAGFWRRSAFLRWQALLLLAVSITKVFLFDISELSQGFRILSFLGLGALLLAVSFVYQRDWLNLRGRQPQNHSESTDRYSA